MQIRFSFGRERGSVPIEGLFGSLMLIIWLLCSFLFFDAFRTKLVVDNASYTISDLISRQSGGIGPKFTNGVNKIFAQMTSASDDDATWIRVTLIFCSASANDDPCNGTDKKVSLTQSYATGSEVTLKQTDLDNIADSIPIMSAGDSAVIVETSYRYEPLFNINAMLPGLENAAFWGDNDGSGEAMTLSEFIVTRSRGARIVWNTSL